MKMDACTVRQERRELIPRWWWWRRRLHVPHGLVIIAVLAVVLAASGADGGRTDNAAFAVVCRAAVQGAGGRERTPWCSANAGRQRSRPGALPWLVAEVAGARTAPGAASPAGTTPASALPLMQPEQDRLPSRHREDPQRLSDRVLHAVQTIQRRKTMFRQYAADIQGKTGLGGIAALAYCRRVVNRREKVWGDLLMIVMENQGPAVEEIVIQAARETLEAPVTKEKWEWFRDNLLSTYLWFSPSAVREGSFVYERLLDIASENLKIQALAADELRFPRLETIPSCDFLPGGKEEIRQDHRLVGNVPNIRQQMLGGTENVNFYDLHVYLNDLLCIARIINPEFQDYLERLMTPMADRVTIDAGPLKSLQRCRAKVEAEYAGSEWPTAARLLDLVRVSITFESEDDLRDGLRLVLRAAGLPVHDFLGPLGASSGADSASEIRRSGAEEAGQGAEAAASEAAREAGVLNGGDGGAAFAFAQKRVAGDHVRDHYSAPTRFDIARLKSGFEGGRGGYRDIKLNVIYQSSQGFAMICEVALCMQQMQEYKDATHELYEILREKDFFSQVSSALGCPLLLKDVTAD